MRYRAEWRLAGLHLCTKGLCHEVNGRGGGNNSMMVAWVRDEGAAEMPMPPSHTQPAHAAPGGTESLVVATGGSATAGGTTTAATGSVDVWAHHAGHASIAIGDASFQAKAGATGSATPTAAATTFFNESGANVTVLLESSGSTQGSTDASAGSTLHFIAIANGSSNPHGPVVIDVQLPFHSHPDASAVDASAGNYAQVAATADAHGTGTTAATVSDATTVENQFSFVHAASLVAV
jgi:hypothetical protein